MRLHAEPFDLIKSGQKTVEVRLNDEKRQQIKVGDEIEFSKRPDLQEKIVFKINSLPVFSNFSQVFQKLGPVKLGLSPDFTAQAYEQLMGQYYSAEDVEKYGVLAIIF